MRGKRVKAIRRLARHAAHRAMLRHTDLRPDDPVSPEDVERAVRRFVRVLKRNVK